MKLSVIDFDILNVVVVVCLFELFILLFLLFRSWCCCCYCSSFLISAVTVVVHKTTNKIREIQNIASPFLVIVVIVVVIILLLLLFFISNFDDFVPATIWRYQALHIPLLLPSSWPTSSITSFFEPTFFLWWQTPLDPLRY